MHIPQVMEKGGVLRPSHTRVLTVSIRAFIDNLLNLIRMKAIRIADLLQARFSSLK
jgi:hypothetical protein